MDIIGAASEAFVATSDIGAFDVGPKLARGRKNLFGRADVAAVYRRAGDLLVEHGVFRMVRVTSNGDGDSSVFICNLWRIDRSKQGLINTLEFDLCKKEWIETREFEYWPDIHLCPIQNNQTLDWWRDIVHRAVWKALIAAGYNELPYHIAKAHFANDLTVISGRPDMSPSKMASILLKRYLGNKEVVNCDTVWGHGVLKPNVMAAGARALRAAIFHHVYRPDLLSAILAIRYKVVTLRDYLQYAVHTEAVLRVAREHRNLLPLLPEIAHCYWDRKDLFSRKLWVKDGRKRTVLDYTRFASNPKTSCFQSLDSRAAWRWLSKAQLTVVRQWAWGQGGSKNTAVLENLARANIAVKLPALAWCHIIIESGRRRSVAQLGVCVVVQRLYRAFAIHCARLWKEQGFSVLREWLKNGQSSIGDLADWLTAEGIDQGFPDKHATWDSLNRRCDSWHERVAIENVVRGTGGENQIWISLLGETVIGDVIFTPLNSVSDVAVEGCRQHHCVGNYSEACVDGRYRVYSVLEPDGTRSTLGLWLNSKSGRWDIEQHRGKYNGPVSVEAAEAGLAFIGLYQRAHLKQAGA